MTLNNLLCTGLIERDSNNDILWTWSYPSVSNEQRQLVLKKCSLDADAGSGRSSPFIFGRFQGSWFYLSTTEVFDSDCLPRVKQFVLVLWAKDFHPEKYETLSRILSKTYCKTGNPAYLLQLYLSVITSGSCQTEENGTFLVKDFHQKKAYLQSSLKSIINTFKLETILIYTALMLKKRIVVYHHRLNSLQQFLRALPAFVWHRQNWQILYPYVDMVDSELSDLKATSTYAAGFVDAAVESRTDLYDIFINLAATEIAVASHAKEAFAMSKTHKEIALFMVHLAEDLAATDQQVIQDIANKTQDVLNSLKSFASDDTNVLSLEALKERRLAPALENFLANLAIAENMLNL